MHLSVSAQLTVKSKWSVRCATYWGEYADNAPGTLYRKVGMRKPAQRNNY